MCACKCSSLAEIKLDVHTDTHRQTYTHANTQCFYMLIVCSPLNTYLLWLYELYPFSCRFMSLYNMLYLVESCKIKTYPGVHWYSFNKKSVSTRWLNDFFLSELSSMADWTFRCWRGQSGNCFTVNATDFRQIWLDWIGLEKGDCSLCKPLTNFLFLFMSLKWKWGHQSIFIVGSMIFSPVFLQIILLRVNAFLSLLTTLTTCTYLVQESKFIFMAQWQ